MDHLIFFLTSLSLSVCLSLSLFPSHISPFSSFSLPQREQESWVTEASSFEEAREKATWNVFLLQSCSNTQVSCSFVWEGNFSSVELFEWSLDTIYNLIPLTLVYDMWRIGEEWMRLFLKKENQFNSNHVQRGRFVERERERESEEEEGERKNSDQEVLIFANWCQRVFSGNYLAVKSFWNHQQWENHDCSFFLLTFSLFNSLLSWTRTRKQSLSLTHSLSLSLSCLSSFLPEFKEKENDEKETKKLERSGIESISEGENLFPD